MRLAKNRACGEPSPPLMCVCAVVRPLESKTAAQSSLLWHRARNGMLSQVCLSMPARPSRCLVRFALAEIDQRRRPTQRHLRSERQMIDTEASMRACGSWSRHRWCHGIVALGCLRPAIAPRCVIGLARSAVGTYPSTIFWLLKVEGPRPRLRVTAGCRGGSRREGVAG